MVTNSARILIADDDQFSSSMLRIHLEKFGYRNLIFVENGRSALEVLRSSPVDLLLLDMQMPEMSGIEVLREVKSDLELNEIPVIVISGENELDLVLQCIEVGAEDYLGKPVDPRLLSARLRNVFERLRLRKYELEAAEELKNEKRKSDALLDALLPRSAIDELKSTGLVKARKHQDAVVLFCDISDFTIYCSSHSPEEVVNQLETLFGCYDKIVNEHRLEKIKTIGDAYMAVASLSIPLTDPLRSAVACGLEMVAATDSAFPECKIHVGIAQGPLVSGIVGREKFQFDVWGDTVNVAARMVSIGRAGVVTMPEECWQKSRGNYVGKMLGEIEVKGKGRMRVVECSDIKTGDRLEIFRSGDNVEAAKANGR